VPGKHGGFDIHLRDGYLEVNSWCRVVGGSGQFVFESFGHDQFGE
jgi:hypothetical protein